MADIPLVQLPYPEEETRTFELSTSLSPNWDKNGRIFYTDETGQVVRPQTKYNPLQMLGRRLKAFGSNAKNFVEDFNMDKSHTYFAPFEDINAQYKAGNIDKSELPYLAQGRAEQEIRDAQQQERDNINRGWVGAGLSAASMHPIFNIPYVGTGIGGAMYDLGQGITEGNNADELWDRTKRGFAIGESVGAIPYVGKLAGKTKAGQAVGSVLNKAGERFANTKLYDALMTDIRAFNPNKQTAYHGSPYDFNKFSNEAIGTGEGAQAHGYGHYAALDKGVANNYRWTLNADTSNGFYPILYNGERVPTNTKEGQLISQIVDNYKKYGLKNYAQGKEEIIEPYKKLIDKPIKGLEHLTDTAKQNLPIVENIDTNAIKEWEGQLYKLSVPKDDVMLREMNTYAQQPKPVQNALKNIVKNENKTEITNLKNDIQQLKKEYDEVKNSKENYMLGYAGEIKRSIAKAENRINYLQNDKNIDDKATNILADFIKNKNNPDKVRLLNENGIKGISYNGGIDGEARVIFNPDDIVIGRKYYNQPNLYQQLTGKQNTGALVDALFNR